MAGNGARSGAVTPRAPVERLAPAKVNLILRITGRRPAGAPQAGYHELDSLVVFAGVGDRLVLAPAKAPGLSIGGPFAAALAGGGANLALTALKRLAELCGRPPNVAIRLEKNLPVAAGIGGGSADAAAVLSGLVEFWGLDPADRALARLALSLGADVPVCLAGRPCRVAGIGERITPLAALPPAALLLVNPGVPLATPPVFAARQGPFSAPLDWPERFADAAALARFVAAGGNDLTAAAATLVPAVREVLAAVSDLAPLASGMSGSGATCFALFDTLAAAEAAARVLRARQAGWWIAPAALLS
jgi:4-diphosphocytidyl-2-C-methyl-D-erythritol kinase